MAKKKPDEGGLTADELKEVETLEGKVQAEEAAPEPSKPAKAETAPADPAELEAKIAELQKQLYDLHHPVIEFPKMVKGHTFQTRAEQDAAGPEFAD